MEKKELGDIDFFATLCELMLRFNNEIIDICQNTANACQKANERYQSTLGYLKKAYRLVEEKAYNEASKAMEKAYENLSKLLTDIGSYCEEYLAERAGEMNNRNLDDQELMFLMTAIRLVLDKEWDVIMDLRNDIEVTKQNLEHLARAGEG